MRRALVLLFALAGCSGLPGGIGSSAAHDAVAKRYDQEVQFDAPRACDLYLVQRTTDEEARVVEYDAQIGGRPISIVYSIVPDDPYPLQLGVYDASGTNTFDVVAADHALEVRDVDGAVLRHVDGYDGAEGATAVSGSGQIDDADGLALLGCALADRSTLGDIAAFLRNLSSGGEVPGAPDVGQSSANSAPLLPDWKGNTSLLGAFWLMSGCLDASGWRCGCWQSMNDKVIGPVPGWCP